MAGGNFLKKIKILAIYHILIFSGSLGNMYF